MYGTYQRLDVSVWAHWRAVIRASNRKIAEHHRLDPMMRDQRKRFYRMMLDYHRGEQRMCRDWAI